MIQPFFSRALDSFLGYQTKSNATSAQYAPAAQSVRQPAAQSERVVGTGAPNESMVVINDTPVLFVEEPDCVVHFTPAFGFEMRPTKVGVKMVPDLVPYWEPQETHHCSVKEAVAAVIQAGNVGKGGSKARATHDANPETRVPSSSSGDDRHTDQAAQNDRHLANSAPVQSTGNKRSSHAAVTGRVKSWGEERFPNRKPEPGEAEFYTSFAMRLNSDSKEEVLQGEGLKDAITISGCGIGDLVSVKRLRKEKVQAFSATGEARMRNGEPVFHYKWIWQINIIKKGT
jgi:hypothetical protein